MDRSGITSRVATVSLGLAIASVVLAGDDPAKPEASVKSWKDVASRYRIELDSGHRLPLSFREEPVLKWTNPERKTDDGAVFVWTHRGRAEVAASFYHYKREGVSFDDHEFISLSTHSLTGVLEGEEVWSPPERSARPAPIPGAPKPATTANERLRQMRALAREFKATFNNPPDLSEIRLLTQPLYRFETEGKQAEALDGALFAYVHTTDPEVLLTIEARPEAEGKEPTWHYSLARMSMVNMRVHHKDREVWSVQWDNELGDPSKPYMVRTLRPPSGDRPR